MTDAPSEPQPLPDSIWYSHEYTSIHAAIIFADLENSVMISSTLAPADYDTLITEFQQVMLDLVESLKKQGLTIGEYFIAGDQLALFLYDPTEIDRNWQLDAPESQLQPLERAELVRRCSKHNENLTFSAFKAAVQLKNLWLAQSFNMRRVLGYREPLGLGIGLHYGRVYLCNRPDGKRRIEGYAVNLAKRIEGFSRQGLYSRIMLSQECHDILRGAVVQHTQLRQRIFFHEHMVPFELLKGVPQLQRIYELKFFHRLSFPMSDEVYSQYAALFSVDRTNSWAYYQLFDYYAYRLNDWDKAFELAKAAQVANPKDEKILLDLAKCYLHLNLLEQSVNLAEQSLKLNDEFDLAHEHLAEISSLKEDLVGQIRHFRDAVRLSPNSPVNAINLGFALITAGEADEGARHVLEAVELYPDYPSRPNIREALLRLAEEDKLPSSLACLLPPSESAQ